MRTLPQSLRWHYPDQVRRGRQRCRLPSQPGIPSSPRGVLVLFMLGIVYAGWRGDVKRRLLIRDGIALLQQTFQVV